MFTFQCFKLENQIFDFILKTFNFAAFSSNLITQFFDVKLQNQNAFFTKVYLVLFDFVLLINLSSQLFADFFILSFLFFEFFNLLSDLLYFFLFDFLIRLMFRLFRQRRNLSPVVDCFFIVGKSKSAHNLLSLYFISYFFLSISTHGEKYLNKLISKYRILIIDNSSILPYAQSSFSFPRECQLASGSHTNLIPYEYAKYLIQLPSLQKLEIARLAKAIWY